MLRRLFFVLARFWRIFNHYIRNFYYRTIFSVDDSVIFLGSITYSNPKNICIGRNVSINPGVFFNVGEQLIIGSNVTISAEVFITTVTLCLDAYPTRVHRYGPVTIKNNVWLGARSIVLPNVTIGEGSIIAAGSVVTSDVEPFCLYGGVPARKIRQLPS